MKTASTETLYCIHQFKMSQNKSKIKQNTSIFIFSTHDQGVEFFSSWIKLVQLFQVLISSRSILWQNQHLWSCIPLATSEDMTVPAFLMDRNYYKNYFLVLWKKNINNFQDISQHRKISIILEWIVAVFSPALTCRKYSWMQRAVLYKFSTPARVTTVKWRAEHTHLCWPFVLNPCNSISDRGKRAMGKGPFLTKIWKKSHFSITWSHPFGSASTPPGTFWNCPKPNPSWSRVLLAVTSHLTFLRHQRIPHSPGN